MDERAKDDILVVDDDEAIRDALYDALRDEGYSVATVTNGLEALGYLTERRSAPPRLILLDIRMPVMDGLEFLDTYGADPVLPGIPIVVMSAHVAPEAVLRCNWVVQHIAKPLDLDRLYSAVQRWCTQEPTSEMPAPT